MKKLLLFLTSIAAFGQNTLPQFTWGTPYFGASSTYAVNGATLHATTWFTSWSTKTLSGFGFQLSGTTGTVGATDLRADLISFPWPTVTYDDASNEVRPSGGNPYSDGQQVALYFGTGPAGVTYAALYYVCNADTDSFNIDDNADCMSIVTDFSGSSGTQQVTRVLERTTTISATPSGAGWYTMTFNTALALGGQYGVRIANTNGTPASNYFTLATGPVSQGLNPRIQAQSNNTDGRSDQMVSTCTAVTCGAQQRAAFYRLSYSDSSFDGQPFASAVATTGVASGDRVQGTVEVGTRFAVPSYMDANVRCVWMPVTKTGTPAALSRVRIYTGANGSETLAATSETRGIYDVSLNANVNSYPYCFSSAVRLTSGTVVRVVLSPSASGDTSTNYYSSTILTIHNDANSKALVYGMKAKYDGSSWTYTDTEFVPFVLVLDQASPFNNQATGGGSFIRAN